MEKLNKKQIHPYVDSGVCERFERLYPHTRSRFIENAMRLALNNSKFFDEVFFSELLRQYKESEI